MTRKRKIAIEQAADRFDPKAVSTLAAELLKSGLGVAIENAENLFSPHLLARCESPIEQAFLAALFHPDVGRQYDMGVDTLSPKSGLLEHCRVPQIQTGTIWVWQQVNVGPYRVDFLMDTYVNDDAPLVIECDGHDFHEKTKDQAQRDKSRDHFLLGRGLRVIRFTGSEIHRDPIKVVHEAIQLLLGIAI